MSNKINETQIDENIVEDVYEEKETTLHVFTCYYCLMAHDNQEDVDNCCNNQ